MRKKSIWNPWFSYAWKGGYTGICACVCVCVAMWNTFPKNSTCVHHYGWLSTFFFFFSECSAFWRKNIQRLNKAACQGFPFWHCRHLSSLNVKHQTKYWHANDVLAVCVTGEMQCQAKKAELKLSYVPMWELICCDDFMLGSHELVRYNSVFKEHFNEWTHTQIHTWITRWQGKSLWTGKLGRLQPLSVDGDEALRLIKNEAKASSQNQSVSCVFFTWLN